MSLTEEQFLEILDGDVLVDKDKLISGAKYGVPDSMRSKVWMYLLNISDSSHHFEGQQVEERNKYYKSLRPTTFLPIKNAVNTAVHHMALTDKNIAAKISNILCNFFSCDPNIHFNPGIVNLTIPLYTAADGDEVSAFFMLTNLLDRLYSFIDSGLHLRYAAKLGKYINIFMPELANHFENEDLDPDEVFAHWFQFLHSTALPLKAILRLWDTYLSLSADDLPKELLYVSLALVERFMPKILRLEHLDILNFLSHLPMIDVDVLLVQAGTMRAQLQTFFQSEPQKKQSE
ncbi:TBC domain containing protein [Tritrichomonas foetus]|uniref:TBC domain containing protein n=1 Tax=Tritrichomonas foetus TaxID=1144522 RepID=A0A1J4KB90_9EUKA|nr:TBC domain containing protein [Tritrichomonas foetus]|eukprot:OHT06733.1 TBC domain containing protein [Tritrichomonas foetus]